MFSTRHFRFRTNSGSYSSSCFVSSSNSFGLQYNAAWPLTPVLQCCSPASHPWPSLQCCLTAHSHLLMLLISLPLLHYNAARSRLLMLLTSLSLLACTLPQMVRRGSVGSASACCKAGPSSILGSAPQGGVSSNGKSSIVEERILRFVFVPSIVEERTLRFCLRSFDS